MFGVGSLNSIEFEFELEFDAPSQFTALRIGTRSQDVSRHCTEDRGGPLEIQFILNILQRKPSQLNGL